jgi:hypothetical protein
MHEWNRRWSQTQGLVVCQWFFLVDLLVVSLAHSGLITFAHWAQSDIVSIVFTFHCSLGCMLGRPIPYIISWDHPAEKTAATYLAGHEPHHTFLLFLYWKTSAIPKVLSSHWKIRSVRISKVIHLSLFTKFLPIMMAIVYDWNENMEAIGALFLIII